MSGGFQTVINTVPAVGVAGDFASANPRYSYLAGPGALVTGASGLTVGLFAWVSPTTMDGDNSPAIANNFGGGPVAGFVPRLQQALITTFLADASQTIQAGWSCSICSAGDFWVKNDGATTALWGQKAYAAVATGKASFAAAGAPTTTTQTSATIATGTAATFTGTIVGNVLTAGTVVNTIYLGGLVSGTNVATGTQIVSQLTGVAGAAGTYTVNIGEQSVASTAITVTPYLAAGTGGSGIVVGSTIAAVSTGITGSVVGGVVTAIPSAVTSVVVALPYPGTGTATTSTITFNLNEETSWYARSQGLAGELIKISNVPGLG